MALGNKTLDDLLAPISERLEHDAVAEHIDLPAWEITPKRVTDGLSHAELVDMFVAEAEKIRVQVKRCSKEELAFCIAKIAGQGVPESGTACSVICADDDRFAEVGLSDALKGQFRVSDVTVWDSQAGDANVDAALAATYGITYASSGIAETATIVQPMTARSGRAISLLPLVHIAVIDATTIKPTMLDVMKGIEAGGEELPSQLCFISGPSATADIELVRVEGVHGPMYVYYVIVE